MMVMVMESLHKSCCWQEVGSSIFWSSRICVFFGYAIYFWYILASNSVPSVFRLAFLFFFSLYLYPRYSIRFLNNKRNRPQPSLIVHIILEMKGKHWYSSKHVQCSMFNVQCSIYTTRLVTIEFVVLCFCCFMFLFFRN